MSNNIKPFEELTLADDFMFYQVMQDDEICIGVLERLLKIDIDHIERQELQKEIKPYYQSKYIKLDVYVKNEDKVYDIEIQNEDMDELPKRVRYYQSMIDSNELLKSISLIQMRQRRFRILKSVHFWIILRTRDLQIILRMRLI